MTAMRPTPLLLTLLVALAPLAGCLGATVTYEADHARVSETWSHDGSGVRNAEGALTVAVSDRLNNGRVSGEVQDGVTLWRVEWTDFREFGPAHDGGIVTDLTEHGDTGIGGPVIPEVTLPLAGWGYATLYRNGEAVADATTGDDTLRAHFMVVDGQLRDAQGRILNADGTAPYDPANPADGSVQPGGPSLFLQLQNRDGSYVKIFEFRNVRTG